MVLPMIGRSEPVLARWIALALAAPLALAACGDGSTAPAGVQRLARGFVPDCGLDLERPWTEADPALTLVPDPDGTGFRVRRTHAAADWTAYERLPGTWWAPRPFRGNATVVRAVGGGLRLEADGEELAYVHWRGMRIDPDEIQPGFFGFARGRVMTTRGAEQDAPVEVVHEEAVALGTQVDGANRIELGALAGDGVLVAPGFPVRLACDLGAPAVLRFAAQLSAPPHSEATLTVRCDGATLAELRLRADDAPRAFELELDAAPDARALELGLAGGPALCGVFAPTLAPARDEDRDDEAEAMGTPADAPGRPDVPGAPAAPADLVLFIADTYRADNLAVHGGNPAIAPQLARFTAESAHFVTAWASSSWTLPSHAAMFSALLPHQARVLSIADRLPGEALTLAEVLAAANWRTAAVTDGGFVSATFGLDQGFEWFDARRKQPAETLAAVREVLERDDGRPLFLVVHSYRAHHPYEIDPETPAATLRALGVRADLDPRDYLDKPASIAGWTEAWEPDDEERQRMRDYDALYRAASHALDRLFGDTRALLSEHLDPARTFLVFTSDHGEAFWEHGIAEHGNGVWNEHVHVPLLVHGPRVAPGPRTNVATNVDLPRTLAALVGVAAPARWGGVDLLRQAASPPALAFQCALDGKPSSFALLANGKKLIASEDGGAPAAELQHAFDVAADPGETVERAGEPWARAMRAGHAALLERAFRPQLEALESAPSDTLIDELRELGYIGDE
jgi:arylsulfatase